MSAPHTARGGFGARGRGVQMHRGVWLAYVLLAGCSDQTLIVGKLPSLEGGAVAMAANPAAVSGAGAGAAVPEEAPELGSQRQSPAPPDLVSLDSAPLPAFCAGRGLPLRAERPSDVPADCGARVASRLFSHALCTCEDLQLQGATFLLDGFDSRKSSYQPGQGTASVGVNGTISQWALDTQIVGSLFIGGSQPLQLADAKLTLAGDLVANGAIEVGAGSVRIRRDLWVGGDIRGTEGVIRVDRDAHQPVGRSGGELLAVTGARLSERALRVPPPCACDAAALDISALVTQARAANDNADVGMTASALRIEPLVTDFLTLPCGRLFVDEITLHAPSTYFVFASARTALFVGGDLSIDAPGTLFVGPLAMSGELDVFVAGDLRIAANSTLSLGGNDAAPSAVRLYVAGQVVVEGTLLLHGALYAPEATLDCQSAPEAPAWNGAVFARSIVRLGSSQLHYDQALAAVDLDCTAQTPQRCDACHQCPEGQACVAGSCGACSTDADCCQPTVCTDGRCEPLRD